MAASDTPQATGGDQTWSEIWQRLQQKESNWQCAGMEGDNGPKEPEGGHSSLSPHGDWPPAPQSAEPTLACLAVWQEGYQSWGATPLPGPSLWHRSIEWPQDPHTQLVKPDHLAELPSTDPGLIRSCLTSR